MMKSGSESAIAMLIALFMFLSCVVVLVALPAASRPYSCESHGTLTIPQFSSSAVFLNIPSAPLVISKLRKRPVFSSNRSTVITSGPSVLSASFMLVRRKAFKNGLRKVIKGKESEANALAPELRPKAS